MLFNNNKGGKGLYNFPGLSQFKAPSLSHVWWNDQNLFQAYVHLSNTVTHLEIFLSGFVFIAYL